MFAVLSSMLKPNPGYDSPRTLCSPFSDRFIFGDNQI